MTTLTPISPAGSVPGGRPALHGVRATAAMPLAEALARYTDRGSDPTIGYVYAPDRAEWFRLDRAVALGPDAAVPLGGVFEAFATDGARWLRWLHRDRGMGETVCLAEEPARLPAGESLPAGPSARTRFGTVERVLAGTVVDLTRDAGGSAWASLAAARYGTCRVPVEAAEGTRVWAVSQEYVVADRHGNLSVVDTLLSRLVARPVEARGATAKEDRS